MNIALIGLMGSGKSTVGRKLARQLGFSFVDTDALIESREGKNIGKIFEEKKEAGFRELEERTIAEAVGKSDTVISCGGGAVENEKNMAALLGGALVFYLNASPEKAATRIKDPGERPLLKGKKVVETLKTLLSRRKKYYHKAHFTVDAGKGPKEVAAAISSTLSRPVKICAVISSNSIPRDKRDIVEAVREGAETIELRVDLIGTDPQAIEELVGFCGKNGVKCAVTCKSKSNGGGFTGNLEQKKVLLTKALECGAEFVDIDLSEKILLKQLRQVAGTSGTKLISSFHDFSGSSRGKELKKTLGQQMNSCEVAKIALAGQNSAEPLMRLLEFARRENFPLIATPMGEGTLAGRVACALAGSFMTYAFVGKPTAPGQPSLRQLKEELNGLRGGSN